jgi:glycosyltransferase involved in cell wall biosynthesis
VANTGRACVVGVGSLFPVKRWDRLLVATAALQQQGLNFLVRIVGDGPLRAALLQQVQALGLAECVEFVAYSADIPGLLAEATLLVHTSDSEGCPNVVLEAMACGRAVVATDAGEVPLVVEDGQTGFVVRRGDNATLITRMAALITDRDLCRRMGAAGRAKAEREFGVERLVADTLAAYRAVGWKDT